MNIYFLYDDDYYTIVFVELVRDVVIIVVIVLVVSSNIYTICTSCYNHPYNQMCASLNS